MIFKNLEIYFLYASSKVRWGITFMILLLIFGCWWHFAFAPLRTKLKSFGHKLENACAANQEGDQQNLIDSLNHRAVNQRTSFVGDHNYFLKDLLAHNLATGNVTINKADLIDTSKATSIKLDFSGPFDKFYQFLGEHHKNYLCFWNSCTCTKNPDGNLSITADITLYSK
jgi:hypothetical protein